MMYFWLTVTSGVRDIVKAKTTGSRKKEKNDWNRQEK
jgi:hypothetical protein